MQTRIVGDCHSQYCDSGVQWNVSHSLLIIMYVRHSAGDTVVHDTILSSTYFIPYLKGVIYKRNGLNRFLFSHSAVESMRINCVSLICFNLLILDFLDPNTSLSQQ